MRTPVWANIISQSIIRLNREFPGIPIGEHIAHAMDGSDIYNISDKDLSTALASYITELELDQEFQSIPDDE